MLPGGGCIEFSYQFGQPPLGNLATPGAQRSPQALAVMGTVNMVRTFAFVRSDFAAARAEVLAGAEMAAIRVWLAVVFHDVHITSMPAESMD